MSSSVKEKSLKSSLVKVRKTIANKFQKLHRDRIAHERKLTEKYAPITDSIKKLIDTKRNIQGERNRINIDVGDPQEHIYQNDEEDVVMNENDVVDMVYENNELPVRRIQRRNSNAIHLQQQQIENRKRDREIDHDENIQENVKRHRFSANAANEPVRRIQRRVRLNRNTIHLQQQPIENRKRAREIDHNENLQENVKRHRLLEAAADANEPVGLREDLRNIVQANEAPATTRRQRNRIISPDDYDNDGVFQYHARKRRKIEIKLPIGRSKQKRIQNKIKKIKLRGGALEENFIPYTQNIAYEYYDDPNELVDRLRLLVASKSSGNSNHAQEINSILEELRERKLIE